MHELCNRPVAFDVFRARASRQLAERLDEAATDGALVRTIDRFLLSQFDPSRAADPIVEHCVQAIEHSHGRGQITGLAAAVGLSPRQLQRRFDAHVGLTPKKFATIVRFQRIFRVVEQERAADLTQAGIAAGYFDQAHFIHSFKALTGLTPSRFFREPGNMAPLFAGR